MRKRVLVVDDDVAIRESLKKVLETADYEVALAADGQEAVERFGPSRPDLLILDLNLPIKSGWEAFENLTRANPCVPVIIITGLANQHEFAALAGAGALLEKPVEVPALLETMEKLLAEPKETHLRRLSGCEAGTRYVPREFALPRQRLAAKARGSRHIVPAETAGELRR